eukprot:3177685-Amphidinium_carterae.1
MDAWQHIDHNMQIISAPKIVQEAVGLVIKNRRLVGYFDLRRGAAQADDRSNRVSKPATPEEFSKYHAENQKPLV